MNPVDGPLGDVLFPDAPSPVALPAGWTLQREIAEVTLVDPEGDTRVSFVAETNRGTPGEIADRAWRRVDEHFDLAVRNLAEAAPAGGWDGTHEVTYQTPAAQGRYALAIIRLLRDRAYVSLLSGTTAGVSRRLAQIGAMIEAWRPEGLVDVDLRERKAARWSATESAALGDFMRDTMRDLKVPGAAIAIVQNGTVVFAHGFGVTSVDDPRPVTADTPFMISSTTKSLTTLMMARLVALGRFAWTTPVTSLLPDFALADPVVTAKLQMRHTVGAGTGMPRRDIDLFFRINGVTAADRIAEMREMQPTTGFGETFQYSNYLVAAGGYAAARAFTAEGSLETAYENAMRTLVFEPLGMASTTVAPRDDMRSDEAAPHAFDLAGNVVAIDPALEHFADAVAPAGAARSTVCDLARYLLLELSGDAPAERREPQIAIDANSSYGLGLILTREHGIDVIGHGGNTTGFTSDMFFLPEHGIGAVVVSNLGSALAFRSAVRQRLFELFFAAPETAEQIVASDVRSRETSIERKRDRIKTDVDATAWLAAWVGAYHSKELGPARISHGARGYRVDFESWGSDIGVETQSDGARIIVLITPPWSGSLRLQPAANGNELLLDGAQTKYVFTRH